ncbi:MAG: hypothetical protein JWN99_1645 [Ilumatobacteraceae bacterium]|nr:hypothetical protein [Ilumatobacteraceae bacterium]
MPVLALGLISCSDDKNEPAMVEPDEVYAAVIRWQLARQDDAAVTPPVDGSVDTADTAPDTDLPVVYVAAADGSKISAKVQARVAAATVDDANVRFADSPDDAVDQGDDSKPVIDDGVLLSVEKVDPKATQQQTTEVVVYRSQDDQQTWVLTIDPADDGATITASSLQPN